MPGLSSVEEIKDRLNIVDVVSSYVRLQKAGHYHKGLCPFHTEKTPSFFVFPDKGYFRCFGCGANGDIFGFLMKVQNLDFGEALRILAERAGVVLPSRRQAVEEDESRAKFYEITAAAAQYFHNLLANAAAANEAREYLKRRGINWPTAEAFQLGYSLDRWDALSGYLTDKGYTMDDLVTSGVVIQNEEGRRYDRFRGRLMFPVRDRRGRVTGFGARCLDKSEPKYLNSPQTPIFDKSGSLYGIDRAGQAIRDRKEAVVVEGYMDVLAAHQAGFQNVVASLGTALTEKHIALLKQYTKNVALALDPDAAGDEATLRGLEVARETFDKKTVPVPGATGIRLEQQTDATIRVVQLPRGKDPDEVIQEAGENWQRLVETAIPVVDYYIEATLSKADLTTAKGKAGAVGRLAPILAEVTDKVQQAHYLQALSERLKIAERALLSAVSRSRRPGPHRGVWGPTGSAAGADAPPIEGTDGSLAPLEERGKRGMSVAEYSLALIMAYPEFAAQLLEIRPEEVSQVEPREIMATLQTCIRAGEAADWERLRARLDPSLHDYAEGLMARARNLPPVDDKRLNGEVELCLADIRRLDRREQIEQLGPLRTEAEAHNDEETVRQIDHKVRKLSQELERYERRSKTARAWRS